MSVKKQPVTASDVAKLAGVSQSTVSRVFIDGSSVSAAAREKVFAAAKELNYRPNAFARSLTTNESKLIGLVFPDSDYPIHMETLQLLSKELQKNGYSAVLIPWELDAQQQHSIPNIFQYRVDGVMAASAQFNTALYEECQDFNIPIVQFARVEEGTSCSSAISDNYSAGKLAARTLVERGAKKLAYLTGDIPSYTNNERLEGFTEELTDLTGSAPREINTSYVYEQALEGIRAVLAADDRPDAFFCSTDILAIALMDVAKNEFGLSIPEDFQVLGFDDIPQASWLGYQLSTFKQDFNRLAKEAVKQLLKQVQTDDQTMVKLMIPVELVERGTLRSK
ncbi:LacI family DNA-binding transcriptional regulator [Photobacterium sanctipauli]|uniref:LacI family DNA-binding transcriptional regulator n=1 Tax=Photobacterium sanctipauli TaxID=1342794 RepID=A0A2T3NP36_9GAMM|nr:LacI family DNA-binding transcriptional regulator [Photobacterium sanctipauli]PSW18035.1 LacI family DNA-binding transcriptional regulator [Photobacterium sanctipauli]